MVPQSMLMTNSVGNHQPVLAAVPGPVFSIDTTFVSPCLCFSRPDITTIKYKHIYLHICVCVKISAKSIRIKPLSN